MSLWLFSIFTDRVLHETKVRALDKGIILNCEGRNWELSAISFANAAVFRRENEEQIRKLSLTLYVGGKFALECSAEFRHTLISISGQELEGVEDSKYLEQAA